MRATNTNTYHFRQGLRSGRVLAPETPGITAVYKEPLTPVADGYGYQGVVVTNEAGTHIQCHICGYYFENLPAHLRGAHRSKVAEYRDTYELTASVSLLGERERRRSQGRWFDLPEDEQQKQRATLKRYAQTLDYRRNGKPRRSTYALERRNREGRCPDQTLAKINLLAEKLGHTPSQPEFEKEYGYGLVSTLKFYFGKYTTACAAAGLRPKGSSHVTDQQLLESIILFRESHGREPTYSDFRTGRLAGSVDTYWKHFGGVAEARRRATQRSLDKDSPEPS